MHVLVADDNSPDGTGDIADKLAAADARVHVLHRKGKEGLGAAYLAGFAWGMDAGYAVIVEMDADGSHRPEDLPKLLAALREQNADLVLGSRWVKGGKVVNWPLHREILSRGGNTCVRLAIGMKLRDATGGFRVFRRETLEGIGLAHVAVGRLHASRWTWRGAPCRPGSRWSRFRSPSWSASSASRRCPATSWSRRCGAAPSGACSTG